MSDIPLEEVKGFKCKICNGYLSYFPIFLHKDGGSVCNRCFRPYYVCGRNEQLEKVLKYLKFPCNNEKKGCKAVLLPSEIDQHVCIYRQTSCLRDDCIWKGDFQTLIQHFNEFHRKFVITNDKIEFDLTGHFMVNYLIMNEYYGAFVLRVSFAETELKCELMSSASEDVKNFICQLYLTSFRNPKPIVLTSKTSIRVPITERFMIGRVKINRNLPLLDCFYCSKQLIMGYNREPCVCRKGHILCENCSKYHKDNCGEKLSTNESFERISNTKYECKFKAKGCGFSGPDKEKLEIHEFICAFKKCMFCDQAVENFAHYNKEYVFLKGNNYEEAWQHPFYNKFDVIYFDNNFFKLEFLKGDLDDRQLCFSVKLTTNAFVFQRYTFELERAKLNGYYDIELVCSDGVNYERGLTDIQQDIKYYVVNGPCGKITSLKFTVSLRRL